MGSGVRYSSRASKNIVLVVAPEAMSTGREAQVKLQAWGVCSSSDQIGRSGAGAKHSREGLDAQSSEWTPTRVDRVVSVSLTAPRPAPNVWAALPMLRPPRFQSNTTGVGPRTVPPRRLRLRVSTSSTGPARGISRHSAKSSRAAPGSGRAGDLRSRGTPGIDDQSNDIMRVIS